MASNLFIFFLVLNVECYRYAKVKDFQLFDLKNSSLRDQFPVYFLCKFQVLNSNTTILFQRQANKNFNLNPSEQERLYHNYESVQVSMSNNKKSEQLSATAILFPNKESLTSRKRNSDLKLEVLINIFNKDQLFLELKPKRNSTGMNKRNSKYFYFY